MKRTHLTGWLLGGLLIGIAIGAAPAEHREGPLLRVPRISVRPVVDGVLGDGEWAHAAMISGFIGATGQEGGRMLPLDSRIYLAHDGKRFYLAVYCQLPPGVKPSMKYRRRDEPVYMDNYQLELWLAPPVRDRLVTYQMIGNAYGAIYDNRQIPDLGAVSAGWNGHWQLRNDYRTGEYWTAELSVPFADFGITDDVAGQVWRGLVAIAWPQRSWPYTFGWYKNVGAHARLVMADDASCVRVDDLTALFENQLAPKLSVRNGRGDTQHVRVTAECAGVSALKELDIPGGGTGAVAFSQALPPFAEKPDKRRVRLTVTGSHDLVLLRGDWFYVPMTPAERQQKPAEAKPWALQTRVQYAPLSRGLKLWADVLDFPDRQRLATVKFSVRPAAGGPSVASRTVTDFAYDAAETYLWLPKDLAFGDYDVRTVFRDAAGQGLASGAETIHHRDLKEEFVWLNSDYGEHFTVAPPFEPISTDGATLRVWGREMQFAGGLPAQIVSQGAPLLSGPVCLVAEAGGERQTAQVSEAFQLTGGDGNRRTFRGAYRLPGMEFAVNGLLDHDGVMTFDLEAAPPQGTEPPVVDQLYLSVPVATRNATYYFSTGGGWQAAFGLVPQDSPEGAVFWDSRNLGDFVPYLALCDDDRSLHWFADNDHDWLLGTARPCAELVRHRDSIEMRIHFVRRPGPVTPFAARFGLVASPIKPLPEGWRNACLHYAKIGGSRINFFYGQGHGGCLVDLHDSAKLAKILQVPVKGKNPDAVLEALPAGRVDWGTRDDAYAKKILDHKGWEQLHNMVRWARNPDPTKTRSCYFFNAKMYFPGYRSKAFRTLFPGEWQLDPPSGWFHLTPTESYQDFFAFHLELWLRHWFVPGLYFDECYLAPDYNVFNGNGKLMPDGTVRPSVPLLQQRRFLRRMRQLFLDHGEIPFIWVHSSNYMAPHAISAADVAMFGEDRSPTPQTDIIDTAPALLLRSLGRAQKFGFIPLWMVQAGRGGSQWSLAGRQSFGWFWMHDVVPEYHTVHRGRPLAILRAGWGIDQPDVGFVPYWAARPAARCEDPEVLVSAWTRPGGRAMLMVLNLHYAGDAAARPVALQLDPEVLGLTGEVSVCDLESDPVVETWLAKANAIATGEQQEPVDRKALRALQAEAQDLLRQISYDRSHLRTVGNAGRVSLSVPPRDFKVLVVEPGGTAR